ncbi:accessory Sec system S-layer assembly protein [Geobacillus sp. FSL W8-0032]|uniref:Accessory Sec system S-layer assembly protein n=1 Tax=Geobacillus subterraneus TaxID=129338 RepID=A0A679FNR1_9BACL|nr:accessory Sec system S-layer assembly protein [Geobacillus subterraneus]BBW97673.1 accessory Sec system S-layer assembly protein [Geobacillus subterraneus]
MIFRKKQRTQPQAELPAHHVEQPEVGTKTTLSFHPDWQLSPEETYVYRFYHEQLPPLQPNQISISGVKLVEYNDGFVAVAMLRNTLPKPVLFERIRLLLLGEDGTAIARKEFDMSAFGELPPMTARPWRFLFAAEDKLVDQLPKGGWKVAFELPPQHRLELEESWEQSLSAEQRQQLQALVDSVPPPARGEVNFMGIEAKQLPSGELAVTLLIRNGSDQQIRFEQIPLEVRDHAGDIVARGLFACHLEVKVHTSKPWTFLFPPELLRKAEPDWTSWKVTIPSPPVQSERQETQSGEE